MASFRIRMIILISLSTTKNNKIQSALVPQIEEEVRNTYNDSCFSKNARDSGTDVENSIVMKTKTVDAKNCQLRCQLNEECEYFLYFTRNHPQWYKRRECRLLRQTGVVQAAEGHISGAKFCETPHKNSSGSANSVEELILARNLTIGNITNLVDGLSGSLSVTRTKISAGDISIFL